MKNVLFCLASCKRMIFVKSFRILSAFFWNFKLNSERDPRILEIPLHNPVFDGNSEQKSELQATQELSKAIVSEGIFKQWEKFSLESHQPALPGDQSLCSSQTAALLFMPISILIKAGPVLSVIEEVWISLPE